MQKIFCLQLDHYQVERMFMAPLVDFIRQAAISEKTKFRTAAVYFSETLCPFLEGHHTANACERAARWLHSQGKSCPGHQQELQALPQG